MICSQNGNVGKFGDQNFLDFLKDISFSYWDIEYRKNNNIDC